MISKDHHLSAWTFDYKESCMWWPESVGDSSSVAMVIFELEHARFEIFKGVSSLIWKGKQIALKIVLSNSWLC